MPFKVLHQRRHLKLLQQGHHQFVTHAPDSHCMYLKVLIGSLLFIIMDGSAFSMADTRKTLYKSWYDCLPPMKLDDADYKRYLNWPLRGFLLLPGLSVYVPTPNFETTAHSADLAPFRLEFFMRFTP